MTIADAVIASFSDVQGQAGVSIVYARADRAATLTAVPGTTEFEVESGDVIEYAQSRNFSVLASELVLGGYPTTPRRGATIRETIAGVETIFDVRAPAGNSHFAYSDPFRKVIKIFTTQTSES